MGRSAKFAKKVKKTTSNGSKTSAAPAPSEQKKAAGRKAKVHIRKPGSEGYVLGGADYVDIFMGGRRKAREQAAKLPTEPETS